jgi:hypothetical protein
MWGKRFCYVFLTIALATLLWQVFRFKEPRFEGKPLTYWLSKYADAQVIVVGYVDPAAVPTNRSVMAIRQIGPKGLPTLLNLAQAVDPPVKTQALELRKKYSNSRDNANWQFYYHSLARTGFELLGSNAAPAVPGLIKILSHPNEKCRQTAADCLGMIGPTAEKAVPDLIERLADTNDEAVGGAAFALGRIHRQPEVVVPALLKALNGKHTNWTRSSILVGLSDFGPEAKAAIPVLLQLMKVVDPVTQGAIPNIIKSIDPTVIVTNEVVEPKYQ